MSHFFLALTFSQMLILTVTPTSTRQRVKLVTSHSSMTGTSFTNQHSPRKRVWSIVSSTVKIKPQDSSIDKTPQTSSSMEIIATTHCHQCRYKTKKKESVTLIHPTSFHLSEFRRTVNTPVWEQG